MKKLSLIIAATATLGGAAAPSVQAHEWGGGYGYGDGYGHSREVYRDGYRGARFDRREERPAVRIYERRHEGFRHHHHDDFDD